MKNKLFMFVLLSISLPALGGSTTSQADQDPADDGVYRVDKTRTTRLSHENAYVELFKSGIKSKERGMIFMPVSGKFAYMTFRCDDAKWDSVSKSNYCTKYREYQGDHVQETLKVGRLNKKFCKDLRLSLEPDGNEEAIMKISECRGRTCLCYKVEHSCMNEKTGKYTETCPDYADIANKSSLPVHVLVPPGRGAGSGVAN